jgi:type IV pilus assembly protein PilC
MKSYQVKALDKNGKLIKNIVTLDREEDVFSLLKENEQLLVEIKRVNKANRNKLKNVELIIFTRQLSSMIEAGVAILKGIHIIQNSTGNAKAKRIYNNLSSEIQRGNALSNAMMKQGGAFPEILINMVAAGEMGGTLEKSLSLMSNHFEKEQKLINKVKSASTYPIILGIISVAVVLLLMTFVLPTITSMFDDSNLPPLTAFVMGISDFILAYWYLMIIGTFLSISLFTYLMSVPAFRLKVDHMLLKMPVIGKLNRTIYSARCARSFASLYLSGIQTLQMIESTAKILNNSHIELLFDEVVLKVSQGEAISTAIEGMQVFDPMLASMVNVGEETGSLGDILAKTADYFDGEAENALSKMVALIEPLMLVVMGIIIGVIVVSVIQPMFGMYDLIGK